MISIRRLILFLVLLYLHPCLKAQFSGGNGQGEHVVECSRKLPDGSSSSALSLRIVSQPGGAVAYQPLISTTVYVYGSNDLLIGDSVPVSLSFAVNPGAGSLSGTTSKTATAGNVTFSGMSVNRSGIGYILQANSTGLIADSSDAITIIRPLLDITQQPPVYTESGTSFSVAVRLTDLQGNTITQANPALTISISTNPGAGTLTGTTTLTPTSGAALYQPLSIAEAGPGYVLSISGVDLTTQFTQPFDIGSVGAFYGGSGQGEDEFTAAAVLVSGAAVTARSLFFTRHPANTIAYRPDIGGALYVYGSNQLLVGNSTSVTLGIANNPGAGTLLTSTSITVSGGTGTFSGLHITRSGVAYTLSANSTGLISDTSDAFDVGKATLEFVQQPPAFVESAVAFPTSVRVTDGNGELLPLANPSISLAFAANPGAATLSGGTAVTASSGLSSFASVSVNEPGIGYILSASANDLIGDTSQSFEVGLGGAFYGGSGQGEDEFTSAVRITDGSEFSPRILMFTRSPSNTIAFKPSIGGMIYVYGASQLLVGNTTTLILGIGNNPGGSSLTGNTSLNITGGTGSFSGLSVNRSGVGYTLTASGTGLITDSSDAFNVGKAFLQFSQQPPASIESGAGFPVSVMVADSSGVILPLANSTMSLAIEVNPGGSVLTGGGSTTAVSGLGYYNTVSLSAPGVGYILRAESSDMNTGLSQSFTVSNGSLFRGGNGQGEHVSESSRRLPDGTAGVGQSIVFVRHPSNTVAFKPDISGQFYVYGSNTLLIPDTLSVEVGIGNNPGMGTLGGTTTVSTPGGVGTFSGLFINQSGTGYTLTGSSAGMITGSSDSFTVSPPTLVFTTQPPASMSTTTVFSTVVSLTDGLGNTLTQANGPVSLTLAVNPSTATLNGTQPVNAVSGQAIFSDLNVNRDGAGYVIQAEAAGGTALSEPFRVVNEAIFSGGEGDGYDDHELAAIPVGGQKLWFGTLSNQWGTSSNWYPVGVPESGAEISIADSAVNNLRLDQQRFAASIDFGTSRRLIELGAYELTITDTFYQSNAMQYIKTASTGRVKKILETSKSFLFPVGYTQYNPVLIANHTGSTDSFAVRVVDSVRTSGFSGGLYSDPHIMRTWEVYKGSGNAETGSGVDLTFYWDSSAISYPSPDEHTLFHYSDTTGWDMVASGLRDPLFNPASRQMTWLGYKGSFSPFAIGDMMQPLPVSWGEVITTCEEEEYTLIQWSTFTEINNESFTVERSKDGVYWEERGSVDGAGTTSTIQYYTFRDTARQPEAYYRIRQTDFNGATDYSDVVYARCNPSETIIRLYPNPTRHHAILDGVPPGTAWILYSGTGQPVADGTCGDSRCKLSLLDLPAGAYVLKADSAYFRLVILR